MSGLPVKTYCLTGVLASRTDELAAALLSLRHDAVPEPHRTWLREQYRLLVPVVLPSALRAVEEGAAISPACLQQVRRLAAGCSTDPVPLRVCLRAGLPAVGVVASVVQRTVTPLQGLRLVHRASVVAHELGSTWVEAWMAARAQASGDEGGEVVPDPLGPDLDPVDQQLLALVAHGCSNTEIAKRMNYSRQAVGWRLSRMMRRWGVTNRAGLVNAAFCHGVLRVPPVRPSTSPVPRGERADRGDSADVGERRHRALGAAPGGGRGQEP